MLDRLEGPALRLRHQRQHPDQLQHHHETKESKHRAGANAVTILECLLVVWVSASSATSSAIRSPRLVHKLKCEQIRIGKAKPQPQRPAGKRAWIHQGHPGRHPITDHPP